MQNLQQTEEWAVIAKILSYDPIIALWLPVFGFTLINLGSLCYLTLNLLGAKFGYKFKDSNHWLIRYWYQKFAVFNQIYIIIWLFYLFFSTFVVLVITSNIVQALWLS